MKKFLLSLCVAALAGVCVVMTSCKDDDVEATKALITENAAAEAAKGYASAQYSYVLDGVVYNSIDDLNAAIAALPEGSNHTAQVIITGTAADGTKTVIKGDEFSFTVPTDGAPVVIPETAIPHLPTNHSGGALN